DQRFARQYRCGPPLEFPLASPRSGIVQHLSGPDRHAPTRTLLRRSWSVGCAPVRDPANHLPCALRVYLPVDWHTCQTPWSDESPALIRFPPDNFKHSLTLFSKSFSSLPRGTCSLSVSHPYLALDEIYHTIGNLPFPTTRLVDSASWCDRVRARRGSHPLWRPFPGNLGPVRR
ncbi:unnamed protein product, partial [Brassica rapa subsp. trilocularis]